MATEAPASTRWLPALALVFNALTWGLAWWPLRELHARGLHPLWATVLIYAVSVAVITLWRPQSWGQLLRAPSLWLLVLAAGTTNAAFNWGVTVGDVVRVTLLFYVMPLWAVLLARLMLGERLTGASAFRVALALAGAAVVLWPADGGWPLPRSGAEWLGLLGGFSFALNNVLLRREAHQPDAARALAMFLGGALVAAVVALSLSGHGVPWPPAPAAGWVAAAAALGAAFLLGNLSLQYGVARLPASVTAVLMVTELVFAAASAVWLGAGDVTPPLLLGGAMIAAASLLATRRR